MKGRSVLAVIAGFVVTALLSMATDGVLRFATVGARFLGTSISTAAPSTSALANRSAHQTDGHARPRHSQRYALLW